MNLEANTLETKKLQEIEEPIVINNIKEFNKVYKNNKNYVLNFINHRMTHSAVAEDIAAETWRKAAKYFNTFDGNKSKIKTWLCTIAKNLITDEFRKGMKAFSIETINEYKEVDKQRNAFAVNSADSDIIRKEVSSSIKNAFDALKPKYRVIADLFFIEQKSYDEISEITDLPLGSVKGMLSRCRAMLQSDLHQTKKEYAM
jgi:RNA polymerase sigma-70 factor (ECF subfamily)